MAGVGREFLTGCGVRGCCSPSLSALLVGCGVLGVGRLVFLGIGGGASSLLSGAGAKSGGPTSIR